MSFYFSFLRALSASAVRPLAFKRESHMRREELIDGLVKFLRLLRHRKVTGMLQLQVLRAGYGPMDLHFILRR